MTHRKAFKRACVEYAKRNNIQIPPRLVMNDMYGTAARDLTKRIQQRNRITPTGDMTPDTILVVGRYFPAVTVGGRAYWAMRCVEGPLEVWGSNRGPTLNMIKKLGSELPSTADWPWCAAAVSWALRCAGWRSWAAFVKSEHEAWVPAWVSASASNRYGLKQISWRMARRGDIACWRWTQRVHQHIGMLGWRPNQLNGTATTIEGNTSRGNLGSQDNGDGMWRRTRDVRPPHVIIRVS
jgi:hypothetical protein